MTGNEELRRRWRRWVSGTVVLLAINVVVTLAATEWHRISAGTAIWVVLLTAPFFLSWMIFGTAWVLKARSPESSAVPINRLPKFTGWFVGAVNGGGFFLRNVKGNFGGDTTLPGAVFLTVLLLGFAVGVGWLSALVLSRVALTIRAVHPARNPRT